MSVEVVWFLIGAMCGGCLGYIIAALMNITAQLEKEDNELGYFKESEDEQSRRDKEE